MTTVPAKPKPFRDDHPLIRDATLCGRVLDAMFGKIQKVLFPNGPRGTRTTAPDRMNPDGISAQDVLQESFAVILKVDRPRPGKTWEGLGVGIAENKAMKALDRNTSRRRVAGVESNVISIDRTNNDEAGAADRPAATNDSEAEALAILDEQKYAAAAGSLLSERDLDIYTRVHHGGETYVAVAADHGMRPEGVKYAYIKALRTIHGAAQSESGIRRASNPQEGQE